MTESGSTTSGPKWVAYAAIEKSDLEFHRFRELPDHLQTRIWRCAIPSNLPTDFLWTPSKCWTEPQNEYRNNDWSWAFKVWDDCNIRLMTRSGRNLSLVQFNRNCWWVGEVKMWFDIIGVCCSARKAGLEWWKEAVEGMDVTAGWGNVYFGWESWEDSEWDGQNPHPFHEPDMELLGESKRLVVEVLGEGIADAQWMLDNPEDAVAKRKRLCPPRDNTEFTTKTFHGFPRLPPELQIRVWEEEIESSHTPTYLGSFGWFRGSLGTRDSNIGDLGRHRLIGPKSRKAIYLEWSLQHALHVCRLSRFLALKGWIKFLQEQEELEDKEDEDWGEYRGRLGARVLQVLRELKEEVNDRLVGRTEDRAGCRNRTRRDYEEGDEPQAARDAYEAIWAPEGWNGGCRCKRGCI